MRVWIRLQRLIQAITEPVTSAGDDVAGMDASSEAPGLATAGSTTDDGISVDWSWDDDDAAPTSDEEERKITKPWLKIPALIKPRCRDLFRR
jgi:hypothetical protein